MKSKINKWKLFSEDEREKIMVAYDKVSQENKSMQDFSDKMIRKAASGIYLGMRELKHKKLVDLYLQIMKSKINNEYPIVHEDSMTAWGNRAVDFFGLTIGDIRKMKFGENIQIIFFDRNVGDYTDGFKKGRLYNPKKIGLSYATYIHSSGLSGILNFDDIGVVLDNFTWEINLAALGLGYFWGPISTLQKISKTKKFTVDKLDPNILVGWRGPCIKLSDAEKYLPSTVKHYNTWWDDYMPFRYTDMLRKK